MVQTIVFEDGIIVYWDRAKRYQKGYGYVISYNGKRAYTEKTHFSIVDLTEKTVAIDLFLVDENRQILEKLWDTQAVLPEPKKRIDVTKAPYFAVGDGKTLNTTALQRALDDCKENEAVYLPQGTFLTGALDMHSNSELYIDAGGVLQGSANPQDYLPKIKSRFEGIECMCYRSLINMGELDRKGGYNCKNVVIRGKGAVLGGGKLLMDRTILLENGCEVEDPWKTNAVRTRGRLMHIVNTENVIIYGIEAGMAAAWNIHMIYSNNIVTAGCYIHSEEVNNGDGWDPDSSTNCTLFDCDFKTRDDMVAIKSGKNPEGNMVNRPSRNIRVFDCRSAMGHGLAIGSEMSGGIENVYIWDCDIENSRCGLEIKATKKRGGYVKNVYAYNISCSLLAIHSVEYNDDGEGAQTLPEFSNFYFEDICVTGVSILHTGEKRLLPPITVCGFDNEHTAKNITLKGVKIKARSENPMQQLELHFAQNVNLENITCE